MAKQFYTEGTGNQQVLHTAQDDKIPVYENKDAVEADFANLAENQIVATKDMGVDPSVVPVGFIVPQYKKVARKGWLYLDGSEFDENEYPALYLYLGTNVLPDYREFGLVGAEENTTDVYNASTNPTGTIHDHDVYTEGQAKDDQLQDHSHYSNLSYGGSESNYGYSYASNVNIYWEMYSPINPHRDFRIGSVTRGKRKAVYYYIKAVDGEQIANESQFLTTVKNYLKTAESYSTEETLTGGTWIDGKPIYRKTYYSATNWANGTIIDTIQNLGNVVDVRNMSMYANGRVYVNFGNDSINTSSAGIDYNNGNIVVDRSGGFVNSLPSTVIVEYTKTTD